MRIKAFLVVLFGWFWYHALPAQHCAWVTQVFGPSPSYLPSAIEADSEGNIYCMGNRVPPASPAMFISKYNSSGQLLWHRVLSGTVTGEGLAIARDGRLYVAGSFSGSINSGNSVFSSKGESDVFAAAFDTSGAISWLHAWGGKKSDMAKDILVDSNGRVYIAGAFQEQVVFDDEYRGNSRSSFFLACYHPGGEPLWLAQGDSPEGACMGQQLASDRKGNIYVLGTMDHNIRFREQEHRRRSQEVRIPAYQGNFLAKYTRTGLLEWAVKTSDYYGNTVDLKTDAGGNIYVAGASGRYPSRPWIKKYTPAGDESTYTELSSSSPSIHGSASEAFAIGEAGDVYYADHDALLKKDGWNISAKGFYCKALETVHSNQLYVLAWFTQAADTVSIGSTSIAPGETRAFLAKISR